MANLRAARVLYHVHSPRLAGMAAADLLGVLARHPLATGHLEAEPLRAGDDPRIARELLPQPKDFTPALAFDAFARLRQARWIYRVTATEVEPEDLGYLRAALLVAGEIAAMSDGLIVDALAFSTLAAEDVVREVDRPFDPLRHVALHVDRGPRPFFVHTHGMEKFAHADFELHGVPRASLDVARKILRHLVAAVVAGGCFRDGEETQLCGFSFAFGPAELDDAVPHFSNGSLTLKEFRLVAGIATPEMEGLLTA